MRDYSHARGPQTSPRRGIPRPDPLRQSYVARGDACLLSLKFDLESRQRSPSNLAARGSIFHAWAAQALDRMRETGNETMPVDVGIELLHHVIAQCDEEAGQTVHIGMRDAEWLRIAVVNWCCERPDELGRRVARRWQHPERILAIETQLTGVLDVPGPGGTTYRRRISGRPDVIWGDPPDGIIIVDHKSGYQPPSQQRTPPEENGDDKLSDHGFVQQVVYGLLALQNMPVVQRVTLREFYVLAGEYRESTIMRGRLERYQDLLGELVARIDAALDDGPDSERWIATASPGACAICPGRLRCSIRDEIVIPETEEDALDIYRQWHVSGERRKDFAAILKAWTDEHGDLEVNHAKGRRRLGWKMGEGKRFGVYEPVDAPQDPFSGRELLTTEPTGS